MTTQVAVRLPEALVARVDAIAGSNRSETIRRALEEFLYRLECERDAERYAASPLTTTELAMADDPEGWQATPSW